jgi:hypothetical protein
MCQAKRGRKKSTADRRQSDMFQGGERNTLKLSGLAAASAEGRRLRGSFLHPGCLHHANWIRWISRLQDRKKSNWMLMQSRRRCSVFSHLRTNRPSSTSSVWQRDCTTRRVAHCAPSPPLPARSGTPPSSGRCRCCRSGVVWGLESNWGIGV